MGDATKATIETLALDGGIMAGGVQQAGQSALGTAEALKFANRLFNPLDLIAPADGTAAWAQLADGTADALYTAGNAFAHPVATTQAIGKDGEALLRRVDPSMTPKASTFGGEVRRMYDAGRPQGRFLVDAVSLAGAAAPARVAGKLDLLRAPSGPEKYLQQAFSPKAAWRLSMPYKGMGHHVVKRSKRLPDWLGGGPVPRAYSESRYNLLKPEGITQGDHYELHYAVDPDFWGAALGKALTGESWSGKRLGLKKAGWGMQQWLGTPTPMKTRVGGGGLVVGNLAADDREAQR